MARPMSWDDLQYFVAVGQRGSIGAAARWLGVNHSTVLRRLGHLEHALGVRLFDRFASGYVLTTEGQLLLAQLAGIAEQIDDSERRVRGGDLALEGTVRLTSPSALSASLVLPLLADFHALHPGVQVQLVVNDSFLSLTQREADIAVRGSNQPPGNLIGRPVGRVRTALYASRAYLDAHAPAHGVDPGADPSGVERHAWVAPDESLAHLDSARWIARHVPADRIVFRCDHLPALVEAVAAGIGVGLLLCHLADARPGLIRLREPLPALDTRLWVLTHPALKHVARIRALGDFLVQRLGRDPRVRDDGHPAGPAQPA